MEILKYSTPESLLALADNMIQDKSDPSGKSINNLLLEIARSTDPEPKWIRFASILLKDERVDSKKTNIFVIESALRNGYFDIHFLMHNNKIDDEYLKNHSLRIAIEGGRLNAIWLLLRDKRIDPSNDQNYAIRFAS